MPAPATSRLVLRESADERRGLTASSLLSNSAPDAPVALLLRAVSGPGLADQGEPLRMLNRFDSDVHVEVRPVQVSGAGPFDVQDVGDRRAPEPGEDPEGEEVFLLVDEPPQPVGRNAEDFSRRSAPARLNGFHLHAPG